MVTAAALEAVAVMVLGARTIRAGMTAKVAPHRVQARTAAMTAATTARATPTRGLDRWGRSVRDREVVTAPEEAMEVTTGLSATHSRLYARANWRAILVGAHFQWA